MSNILPFSQGGQWYKGNLHCHSTISDGALSPDEIVELYKNHDYNFLSFSDHEHFTHHTKYDDSKFLIFPGFEWATQPPRGGRTYHFLGLQGSTKYRDQATQPLLKHGDKFQRGEYSEDPAAYRRTAQQMIDQLKASGNMVVLNHPVWSRTELEDFVGLDGYFAMEVFNTTCDCEGHTGTADLYWDSLLRRGKKVWGLATDDAHFRTNDHLGGWVMVQAQELTHDCIADSLLEGRFYSSQGPRITDYGVVDGEVFVECSEVEVVHFVTFEPTGRSVRAETAPLRSAKYQLRGNETYVRVECVDRHGRTAWTNPIFL